MVSNLNIMKQWFQLLLLSYFSSYLRSSANSFPPPSPPSPLPTLYFPVFWQCYFFVCAEESSFHIEVMGELKKKNLPFHITYHVLYQSCQGVFCYVLPTNWQEYSVSWLGKYLNRMNGHQCKGKWLPAHASTGTLMGRWSLNSEFLEGQRSIKGKCPFKWHF